MRTLTKCGIQMGSTESESWKREGLAAATAVGGSGKIQLRIEQQF